jgi:uncharacterized membrane protein YuzA (DUF378 family)
MDKKDKEKCSWFRFTMVVLCSLGAINWGLIALFGFNLVDAVFAGIGCDKAVYVIVGLCGVYVLWHRLARCTTNR